MRLSGRSACGAMPESTIATEMPLREVPMVDGALPMPVDLRADVSRAGPGSRAREHRRRGTLRGARDISLSERCGAAEDDERGAGFGIDGANRGAAIE